MRTAPKIRYVAEPKHVREVTLVGTADFGFWSDYLQAERLTPMRCGDAAQVLVVSAEMVYLGVRFTEVSFSIRTVLTQDGSSAGMRLLHAFTSSRVFAWCERTLLPRLMDTARAMFQFRVRFRCGWMHRVGVSSVPRCVHRRAQPHEQATRVGRGRCCCHHEVQQAMVGCFSGA